MGGREEFPRGVPHVYPVVEKFHIFWDFFFFNHGRKPRISLGLHIRGEKIEGDDVPRYNSQKSCIRYIRLCIHLLIHYERVKRVPTQVTCVGKIYVQIQGRIHNSDTASHNAPW